MRHEDEQGKMDMGSERVPGNVTIDGDQTQNGPNNVSRRG